MKRWLIGATAASVVALLAGAASAAGLGTPGFYQELESPLPVTNNSFATAESLDGTYQGIEADIGSVSRFDDQVVKDDADYFKFSIASDVLARLGGGEIIFGDEDRVTTVRLFNESDLVNSVLCASFTGSCGSGEGNESANLAAGDYYLQVLALVDPLYQFLLVDLAASSPTLIQLAAPNDIPEPASLALLCFGLAGLSARRRPRRA